MTKKCPNCGVALMLVEVADSSNFIPKAKIEAKIKEFEMEKARGAESTIRDVVIFQLKDLLDKE
jgi:hypothetical protein